MLKNKVSERGRLCYNKLRKLYNKIYYLLNIKTLSYLIIKDSCNKILFFIFVCILEKNKKRDVRNWYNQEPGTSVEQYRQQEIPLDMDRRGDIPIMSGDCEGK